MEETQEWARMLIVRFDVFEALYHMGHLGPDNSTAFGLPIAIWNNPVVGVDLPAHELRKEIHDRLPAIV